MFRGHNRVKSVAALYGTSWIRKLHIRITSALPDLISISARNPVRLPAHVHALLHHSAAQCSAVQSMKGFASSCDRTRCHVPTRMCATANESHANTHHTVSARTPARTLIHDTHYKLCVHAHTLVKCHSAQEQRATDERERWRLYIMQ